LPRVEDEEVTPTVFLLVFAFLAFAILAIRHFVRSKDVLHGGYIEDSDHREQKVNRPNRGFAYFWLMLFPAAGAGRLSDPGARWGRCAE